MVGKYGGGRRAAALGSPAIHYFLLKFNLPGRHVQCSTRNI